MKYDSFMYGKSEIAFLLPIGIVLCYREIKIFLKWCCRLKYSQKMYKTQKIFSARVF